MAQISRSFFLRNYFKNNCYPSHLLENITRKFLDNVFKPRAASFDVPKKIMYISLPYSANCNNFKRELLRTLEPLYPYINFQFVFKNPLTIKSLFKFKDSLPELMRSSVVYQFSCPKCNFGTYIGCTNRMLRVRIDSHRGVSHRTGVSLSKKEFSAIRNHSNSCHHIIKYTDFNILSQAPNNQSLQYLESLLIKQLSPSLNSSSSSIPLFIA